MRLDRLKRNTQPIAPLVASAGPERIEVNRQIIKRVLAEPELNVQLHSTNIQCGCMAVEDKRNRRDEVAATADRAIPLDYESNRQPRDKDNHMLISSLYSRPVPKKDVNCRRINRERMRSKLAKASFIAVPRLVKLVKS